MIYAEYPGLIIRDLQESDIAPLVAGEIAQGWHASDEKYKIRLRDQALGHAVALAAEYQGVPAGYINVYPHSVWGAFGRQGLPEIVDFSVLEKYRKKGIGSKLMDTAEKIASGYSDIVYLGVGLHAGYGSAQRMYAKRGYIPDGSGVWYQDKVCAPYAPCENDDELVLYLSKKLNG